MGRAVGPSEAYRGPEVVAIETALRLHALSTPPERPGMSWYQATKKLWYRQSLLVRYFDLPRIRVTQSQFQPLVRGCIRLSTV